jgi:hypothetical protein
MADRRIKPYLEQVAARERRERQHQLYRRNQAIGLLLVAAAICVWWLFRTRAGWIFPPGWWRW